MRQEQAEMEMYQQKNSDNEKDSGSEGSDSDDSNQKLTDRNKEGGEGGASNVILLLFRNKSGSSFSWPLLKLRRHMRFW